MSKKLIDIGDLVSIKGIDTLDPIFVWDRLTISEEEFLIVNISKQATGINRLKFLEDKESNNLYSSIDYFLVKEYELLKKDATGVFKDELGEIKEFIVNRIGTNYLQELLFKYTLRNCIDRVEILDLLKAKILPPILDDKNCTISRDDITNYRKGIASKELTSSFIEILNFNLSFLLAKKPINFAACAKEIVLEEVSLLEKLKNDKELLESFLALTNKKNDYSKAQYSPKNTSQDKPIIHSLNPSFFKLIKPEVEAYAVLKENTEQWVKNNSSGIINDNAVNTDSLFNGKLHKDSYPLLFGNLAESLPLGNCSESYKLQFYIAIFEWLMPEVFFDNIRLTPSELKKQHIRNIQKFIAGKL